MDKFYHMSDYPPHETILVYDIYSGGRSDMYHLWLEQSKVEQQFGISKVGSVASCM